MNTKFDGTLVVIKGKKPKGFSSEAAKAAFKDILKEKDMWMKTDNCIGQIKHNEKMEDILIIETKAELEKYMQKYGCTSPDELYEVLWFEYGVTLINEIK